MLNIPTFTGPGGSDPTEFTLRIVNASKPNVYDAMFAGESYRNQILRNTESGLSLYGNPFAAYATAPPYYYYPVGKVGRLRSSLTEKQRQGQKNRAFKAFGKVGERTHLGIKFPGGYSQFKHEGLGRPSVDLRGPRGPHMLNALQVRVPGLGAATTGIEGSVSMQMREMSQVNDAGAPLATAIDMGWWDPDTAARAKGNNEGTGKNKVRNFFPYRGLPERDQQMMERAIIARIQARLAQLTGASQNADLLPLFDIDIIQ